MSEIGATAIDEFHDGGNQDIEQGQVDLRALWKLVERYDLKDVLINKVSNWSGMHDDHTSKQIAAPNRSSKRKLT